MNGNLLSLADFPITYLFMNPDSGQMHPQLNFHNYNAEGVKMHWMC